MIGFIRGGQGIAPFIRSNAAELTGVNMVENFVEKLLNWIGAHPLMSLQDFEHGIGTLLATLAGGLITFGFVLLKARRDRRNSEIAGGTRALLTLMEMWNGTKQYQKEIVDPYRQRRDAWLNLHVGPPLNPHLAFDLKELTFLMQRTPRVLMDVLMEANRYRLATYLVEEHRRLAIEVVWPKLEAAGIKIGEDHRPETEIQKIIGPAALRQMRVVTSAIIANFDQSVQSLQIAFTALRKELIRLFPKTNFVNFNFDSPSVSIQTKGGGTQPYYYPNGP
jgi:hypothetical protein